MEASTSNPSFIVEVGEEVPSVSYSYPLNLCASGTFTCVKLSGRHNYNAWKVRMLCMLASHGIDGFMDRTSTIPDRIHGKGKEKVPADDKNLQAWIRWDAIVKGWILDSLSEQAAVHVVNHLIKDPEFTAKDLWDELQIMYGPPQQLSPSKEEEGSSMPKDAKLQEESKDKEKRGELHQQMYQDILTEQWEYVFLNLEDSGARVTDKIANNGNTILHVAVGTTKNRDVLQKLLELTPPEDATLLEVRNSNESTLLHVAAIVGNSEAATILVKRNPTLMFADDKEGQTPLAIALSNMQTQTSKCMLDHMNDLDKKTLFSGTSGDKLLVTLISSKDFRLAGDYLRSYYQSLHSDAVLMAMAQNFPSQPNIWERGTRYARNKLLFIDTLTFFNNQLPEKPTNVIHVEEIMEVPSRVYDVLQNAFFYMGCRRLPWLRYSWVEATIHGFFWGIYWTIMLFPIIIAFIALQFVKGKLQIYQDALKLVLDVCKKIKCENGHNSHPQYYTNPIFEATRLNAYDVVQEIATCFPDAICSVNEDGHNVIQYAVIHRSEKVYNLLYHMSEHKNTYRTIKDSSKNNLLHLAARLAPTDKLNRISGAALQIQRELQWYKEVEGFVCPLNIIQKNSFGETPQMVFTREHKDLVIEGEKWMKTTAESYTITAALITTIAFAAAITVPGGNKETGIPVFTNGVAFSIFAISNAISLFASVTSLLVFLSVLTARFAEQDFLLKLPTKLIVGLVTLFVSTTAMIVAFGATLYLVFGQSYSRIRILIPIGVLTCLPITSFVTLQFPLVADFLNATYGRSIFGKQGNVIFYRDSIFGYQKSGVIY